MTAREANADLLAEITALRDRLASSAREIAELQGALALASYREAATSEILRVISNSPGDLQPVFDAIARSTVRLCEGARSTVWRPEGDLLRCVARYEMTPEGHVVRASSGETVDADSLIGRAIRERQTVRVDDATEDPSVPLKYRERARLRGYRSLMAVPMMREGLAVGGITVVRPAAAEFGDQELALVKTFADQAVIAIDNVRLFKELEGRNHALTESLDQQTATSEILRVISSSPTDTQPVFDAIAENAARLCSANDAQVLRVEGEILRLVAACGVTSMPSVRQLTRGHLVGRAVIDRQIIRVRDLAQALAEYPETTAARYGVQSALAVPLLREGVALGVIRISRTEIRPFTGKQIALLQTFADQAVIAIENVRLFRELQMSNRELTTALDKQTATSDILRVISRSQTDVQPVFDAILASALRLLGANSGGLTRVAGDKIVLAAIMSTDPAGDAAAKAAFPLPLHSEGVHAPAIRARAPVNSAYAQTDPQLPEVTRELARVRGEQSLVTVPLLRHEEPLGAITVTRCEPGGFTDDEIALLQTFADQAVIAIENVRLFGELEAANRGLAAASQHKSEFLANMSHELRTPLNAIIGFSEVLSERMFGELNEKQEEYLKDIHVSGQHLLSLINDILDLSKIEAGRMELELSDFHLPTVLDSALTLVRERAGRRGIALQMNVDNRLGQIQADERKVRQVVLNLLSNAIKFTPESGRIEVRATPQDGLVEVSVTDTGVGIAPEDQEAVFEEFRQVGTTDKKVEGTGLGLTLCRKFVELHGGKIWVTSEVGVGSTFMFTIPIRHG